MNIQKKNAITVQFAAGVYDQDDELAYKLAMVMMTGHSADTGYLNHCLLQIKRCLVPELNLQAVAQRILTTIERADASWETFFERH